MFVASCHQDLPFVSCIVVDKSTMFLLNAFYYFLLLIPFISGGKPPMFDS